MALSVSFSQNNNNNKVSLLRLGLASYDSQRDIFATFKRSWPSANSRPSQQLTTSGNRQSSHPKSVGADDLRTWLTNSCERATLPPLAAWCLTMAHNESTARVGMLARGGLADRIVHARARLRKPSLVFWGASIASIGSAI
jgi:hypothetical protein